MNAEVISAGKVLSTRLIETLIIGAVILFGVVKVLDSQTQAIIKTQEKMIEKIDAFGQEQATRKTIVYDAKEHMGDWEIHKHNK